MQVAVLGTGSVGRALDLLGRAGDRAGAVLLDISNRLDLSRATSLLTRLGHRDVTDLGGTETARGTEMWLPLWLRLVGARGTAAVNLRVVRPS
jgi:hypothetical protein